MGFFDRRRFGLLGFVFLALSASTHAADYTVTAEAGSFYTRNVTPAGSVRSQTTFAARAMVPAGPVVYTTREVVYSPSTFGKLVKFAASPAGLVTITAAQLFYEWWKSQPGHELTPEGEMAYPAGSGTCSSGGYTWSTYGGWGSSGGPTVTGSLTTIVAIDKARAPTINAGWELQAVRLERGSNFIRLWYKVDYLGDSNPAYWDSNGKNYVGACDIPSGVEDWDLNDENPPTSWAPILAPSEGAGSSQPLTDEEAAEELADSPYGANEDVLRDLASDQNGRPWNTPEIDAMRRAIRDELAAQDGTDPATLPNPTGGTSADPSNPDAPESQPDGWSSEAPSSGGGSQTTTEVPAFCEWAGIVCDWIGWTQDDAISPDPDPDMPFVELPQPAEWDSGFGSGMCPPPIVVPVFSSQVEIPWQPACDLAVMLRPLLLAIAGLSAALILLGQRAGGSGS